MKPGYKLYARWHPNDSIRVSSTGAKASPIVSVADVALMVAAEPGHSFMFYLYRFACYSCMRSFRAAERLMLIRAETNEFDSSEKNYYPHPSLPKLATLRKRSIKQWMKDIHARKLAAERARRCLERRHFP